MPTILAAICNLFLTRILMKFDVSQLLALGDMTSKVVWVKPFS